MKAKCPKASISVLTSKPHTKGIHGGFEMVLRSA